MQKRTMTIAAGLALGASTLLAQDATTGWRLTTQPGGATGRGFQQAGTLIGPTNVAVFPFGGKTVTGSPFSATQERRTLQTLGDGTVLENSETTAMYRDTDGRTRTEVTQNGKTMVTIMDPVARLTLRLDPATKTARKVVMPDLASAEAADKAAFEAGLVAGRGAAVATPRATTIPSEREKVALDESMRMLIELNAARGTSTHANTEDLGMMHQNGVPAQGTRSTLTIPVGQIGNNREIKVVNERWYSQELQMIVKSVNSDPRFGTTTYELKNITRSNPDVSLFQAPADYTTLEGGGRGGRGGVLVPAGK
jgi:hypothetical protein